MLIKRDYKNSFHFLKMKLISFGKIDKKFLICLSLYIIIYLLSDIIIIIFNYYEIDHLNNLELNLINTYGSYILFAIPEYIIRKRLSRKKNKAKKIMKIE